MTLYLNFRSHALVGSVVDPFGLEGDGTANPQRLRALSRQELAARVAGKRVLFGVHGFNVNMEDGTRAFGRLEPLLELSPSSDIFLGVLWPGDFWVPGINYPFEGADAMDCGRRLADFCTRVLSGAASFSFLSHSLGARLVLEAIKHLDRPARSVTLTAAAIKRDCLSGEYASAFSNADLIAVLASRNDQVLKLAFPVGDSFMSLFSRDRAPPQFALGYEGPPQAIGTTVPPWQIPDNAGYDHADYLPPSNVDLTAKQKQSRKWEKPAAFMRRAFRGERQIWP